MEQLSLPRSGPRASSGPAFVPLSSASFRLGRSWLQFAQPVSLSFTTLAFVIIGFKDFVMKICDFNAVKHKAVFSNAAQGPVSPPAQQPARVLIPPALPWEGPAVPRVTQGRR